MEYDEIKFIVDYIKEICGNDMSYFGGEFIQLYEWKFDSIRITYRKGNTLDVCKYYNNMWVVITLNINNPAFREDLVRIVNADID